MHGQVPIHNYIFCLYFFGQTLHFSSAKIPLKQVRLCLRQAARLLR